MRVKIIINPAAGGDEPILNVLNDVFAKAGIEWDVALTHATGDGVVAAREAVAQGFDLVGVYGGDGTVSEVASALAEGGPPMLLLPGGTGNALAEDLGIPDALADAAALATDGGEIRRIDMGRAGEYSFVLRMTMGFEAEMVSAATRELKDRYGWLAYAISGLKTLADLPVATYSVTVDGQTMESEGFAAVIANSSRTGLAGVGWAEDVDVSDGMLDLVVVKNPDLLGWLRGAADAVQSRQPDMLGHWRGSQISVAANPPQSVLSDGEDAGMTPVEVSVARGALRVIVPKSLK